jgi:hypothetical protein
VVNVSVLTKRCMQEYRGFADDGCGNGHGQGTPAYVRPELSYLSSLVLEPLADSLQTAHAYTIMPFVWCLG